MTLKLFCDFDGTITVQDVGNRLFAELGDGAAAADVVSRWKSGEISSKECLLGEAETLRYPLAASDLDEYFGKFQIDPGFRSLIGFCRAHSIDCMILSDGLDLYVDRILEREGLADIPRRVNHAELTASGRLAFEFPYGDEECRRCANCKRNHVLLESGDEDVIVYIGDGLSDLCAARHADVIFAKGELARLLKEEGIPFHSFRSMDEVVPVIDGLSSRRRPKKRWRAELSRRSVFQRG